MSYILSLIVFLIALAWLVYVPGKPKGNIDNSDWANKL